MKNFKLPVLVGATSLFASLLFAANVGPISFSQYDKNSDGLITQEEFNLTKNEQIAIRKQEGRLMRNADNSPDFAYFDKNADGKITPQELQEGQLERMQNRRSNMFPSNKNN